MSVVPAGRIQITLFPSGPARQFLLCTQIARSELTFQSPNPKRSALGSLGGSPFTVPETAHALDSAKLIFKFGNVMGFAALRTREITADLTKSCFPNTTRTRLPHCSTATRQPDGAPAISAKSTSRTEFSSF